MFQSELCSDTNAKTSDHRGLNKMRFIFSQITKTQAAAGKGSVAQQHLYICFGFSSRSQDGPCSSCHYISVQRRKERQGTAPALLPSFVRRSKTIPKPQQISADFSLAETGPHGHLQLQERPEKRVSDWSWKNELQLCYQEGVQA